MKQELKDFYKYVANKKIEYINSSNEKVLRAIAKNLNSFEKPDFYAIAGDTIYIIEHFEFDSSLHNKAGSTFRRNKHIVERNAQEHIAMGEKMVTRTVENNGDSSKYLENLISLFDYHYNQIDSYKKNVQLKNKMRKNTKIKIVFFIVDRNDFGSFILNKGIVAHVLPHNSIEFISHIKNKCKVDYFLFSQEDFNGMGQSAFMSRRALLSIEKSAISFKERLLPPIDSHLIGFQEILIVKGKDIE